MMQRRAIGLILVLGIGALMSPVSAQDQPANATDEEMSDEQRARTLYLRGDRLYAEGRYEESVEAFREAHELSGRPALLFNLANAYERLGHLEQALAALREYAPDAEEHQRSTVLRRIENLETRLAEQDAERRAAAEDEAEPGTEPAPARRVTEPVAPPPETSNPGRAVGIALLAIGGATLGGGLVAGLMATSAGDDAAAHCAGELCTAEAQEPLDQQMTRALAADVLFGVGGALVLSGLLAVLLSRPSSGDDSTRVSIVPTPYGVEGSVATRF